MFYHCGFLLYCRYFAPLAAPSMWFGCFGKIVQHLLFCTFTKSIILNFYFYSTPVEIMIYSIAEKEHKMTRFARAQGSKVRFYGHFWCWLEDKYHKAKTNVLPPVAFVYNEVPNCRITVDTLTLSYGLIFLLISLWWSLYFAETFVVLCPLATFYSRSSSTVSSTQEPVLRSRHFFGRHRLGTSEFPELTPAPGKKKGGSGSWLEKISFPLRNCFWLIKIIFRLLSL